MRKGILFLVLLFVPEVCWGVTVTTVDFLAERDLTVNGAGPLFVLMDTDHGRLIVPHTLTSSISIIDGSTHRVENVPLDGRALQHLKAECMTVRKKTGWVYLVGARSFHIIDPEGKCSSAVRTETQFESIAVDEETGNVFLAGRESAALGFYDARRRKLRMLPWLDHSEPLINLNATPPPPIRKVVADASLGQVIAMDGFGPALYRFDASTGNLISSRALEVTAGARWHRAGYDERTHALYVVIETAERKVVEAVRVDVTGDKDMVVSLPGFTEGVGILYNPAREEVYVPYDNHAGVHVVDFGNGGAVDEIKIPAYGNDASALDERNDRLFVGSWAHGEVDVVDLRTRRLEERIQDLGILPHMFTMAYNPHRNLIYFPKGATAVNGTFGAAVTALDPSTKKVEKIYTGWAPLDLIELPGRSSFLVFNSEDEFAEVRAGEGYELHRLPWDYPVRAAHSPGGDVYLSYGPHQSYWPTVYIWGARNGVVTIGRDDLSFYDRRIPRQAHELALDRDGVLYFTENNWGKEQQFLGVLPDEVRLFERGRCIDLPDTVNREITQRILEYDPDRHWLYLVRIGEEDGSPSVLQVIDPGEAEVVGRIKLGVTATDLVFDDRRIYVSNFDSRNISVVDKSNLVVTTVPAGDGPLALCRTGEKVYAVHHLGNSLLEVGRQGEWEIPWDGLPDNLLVWDGRLVVTSHSPDRLRVIQFDPQKEKFTLLHEHEYPYGDTRFDSGNVSFYVRGQFGDAVFGLTQGKVDRAGRLWITDFLSGKLFILTR